MLDRIEAGRTSGSRLMEMVSFDASAGRKEVA
jgi:hypothetical protein